jgi:hypothetical protein
LGFRALSGEKDNCPALPPREEEGTKFSGAFGFEGNLIGGNSGGDMRRGR